MDASRGRRVGHGVFPHAASDQIRASPALLHFSPVPDPPVDYTIRQKPRPAYRVVSNVFQRDPSPDYTAEEAHLKSGGRRTRADTILESEEVLNDLDNALQEAAIPFEELRQKVEGFNLKFKPYASIDEADEASTSQDTTKSSSLLERARSQSLNRNSPATVPILNEFIVEDLKTVSSGLKVDDVNRNRHKTVEEMYENTLWQINSAKIQYSPQNFRAQYDNLGLPTWKRDLLAEKKSKEVVREVEKEAWDYFEAWKQQFAPNFQSPPRFEYVRPALGP